MPRINWLNVLFILGFPLYGFIQAYWVPLQTKTAIWAVFYYFYTGIGITAGYHRLWAHKAYTATLPLRIWLSLAGAGAVQGSILWWARSHRAHHRYTDTDADPYSIHKGLFHAHFGWMLITPPQDTPSRISTRHTNISDLTRDAIVTWQHTHYLPIVLVMSLVLPTTVAGVLWHDWWGGFIYAGILRTFAIQQATFCVNSLAHWIGDQPFDDTLSPRDHLFTALVTFGEGYHNFHHEFPGDYRNGVRWGQYDPTKWVIALCAWVGLARGLRVFGQNEIEMGRVQMLEKVVEGRKKMVNWGVGLEGLPVLDWGEVSRVTDGTENEGEGEQWIVIHGVVYDVQGFMNDHPGGRALISAAVGKDVTDLFTGGVYAHSNAAHNLLRSMRVGLLRK